MSFFTTLRRLLLGVFLLLLFSAAMVASLGRYFMPYLGDYQSQVLGWVDDQTPFALRASDLQGDWERLSPSVSLRDLSLGSGEDTLSLDRVRIQLNLPYSLWYGKLVFDSLELAGVDLPLKETAAGKWQLDADWFKPDPDAPQLFSLESLYAGMKTLQLRAAKLNLQRADGRTIMVDHLNVEYSKQLNRWQISSHGLPDRSALPINLLVEGRGLPTHEDFVARAYTLLNGFDVSPYLSEFNYQGWTPELPRFDGELWLDYQKNGRTLLQGVVDLQRMRFQHEEGSNTIDIPQLKTQFKLELSENLTPSVWLRALNIRLKDELIAFDHANLVPSEEGLRASFDSINVKPVLRLLRRFEILPAKAQDVLATLDPGGELRDITLNIPKGGKLADLDVAAQLHQVSLQAWKGAPGVENLSGNVYANLAGGIVDVDSEALALRFPLIFHEPLSFATANGPVRWAILPKRVEVRSGALALDGKLGLASAYLDLFLPLKAEYGLDPLMDLQVALVDSDVTHRNTLIPYKLNKGLRDWLGRSVVGGQVADAAFIYRGSLKKQAGRARTIQLYLDVEQAELDYDPAWPAARNLAGKMYLDDTRVQVDVARASVSGLALNGADVRYTPDRSGKGGRIRIKSGLSGELDSALAFLLDSPIRKRLGDALDDWQAGGEIAGQLTATIPIGLDIREQVNVRTRLSDASLSNEGLNLDFQALNGPLRYSSEKGLYSAGIVGTLWSDAVSANIESSQQPAIEADAEPVWATSVNMQGNIRGQSVLDWLRFPLHDFVSGELEFKAELALQAGESRLAISSDLHGLNSVLPSPFDKAETDNVPLDLNLYLNEKPLRMRVQLAERMKGALVLREQQPMTGMLSFGTDQQPSYVTDSLRLQGRLPEFELTPYLDVLAALNAPREQGSAEAPARRIPTVYAQDLGIDSLRIVNNDFADVTAAVASHGDAWTFAFDSENLSGRATYDARQSQALAISLERLYLHTDEAPLPDAQLSEESGEDVDVLANAYPSDLPEMQFRLSDLRLNGKEYGRWAFDSAKVEHGIIFRNLDANSRGMQISGTAEQPAYLRWRRVGDQQQTEFNGVLSCSDLGSVLEAWEYAAAIRSKSCRFATNLGWYGSPLDLALEQMEGEVDILLNNGQFLETNSTANALRIFSLFNFDTLLRRLQFRFDDVFNRGLSYDQITGEFKLANGTLDIIQPFDVKGPSSRLQMTGSLDLVNETVDTKMVATLPISSNLPWVAALAGGLPMAGVVYVAGKIFEKPMSKLSSASYSVTGSWDEPTIKLQKIFDDDADAPAGTQQTAPQPPQAGSEQTGASPQ